MAVYAHIFNDSAVRIWGLTSRQRLSRVLNSAGVKDIVDDIADAPSNSTVLMLSGDYLFDERVISYLLKNPAMVLKTSKFQAGMPVAAHVDPAQAQRVLDVLKEFADANTLADLRIETLETLSLSFRKRLLKFEPAFVLPITAENKRILERRLFESSYKGVTDLITKWVWPNPARWVVGRCVMLGLRPNHVTIASLILAVLAGMLFGEGWYGWGLAAAWVMTFLDTVDGKLARVTVTSSKFGHYFDHLIDLIHPPAWYILWGLGLPASQFNVPWISLNTAFWIILAGYVAGRITEGVFTAWLGKFGIFCWRPIDSYFRLFTARRNSCLIMLTIGVLLGRPDWGLFAVAVWTAVTSFFLVMRLAIAIDTYRTAGEIESWFSDIDPAKHKQPLAVRLFSRRPADLF